MNIHSSFEFSPALSRETEPARVVDSPAKTAAAPPTAVGRTPADGDVASLSPAAVLAAASSALPDVRTEKVASIQQALANGTYAVSASDVAGKVIDHLLDH
jgi:negative regulator of flagellin synthesis FlgM